MHGFNPAYARAAFAVTLALALGGCTGNGNAASGDPAAETDNAVAVPDQAPAVTKLTPAEQVAFAQKDLSERLDVAADAVILSGATTVTWRSGALGCPQPGMNYTQALVPGIWIMLRAGTTVYRYHAATGGQPFFCPDGRAEPPIMGSGAD